MLKIISSSHNKQRMTSKKDKYYHLTSRHLLRLLAVMFVIISGQIQAEAQRTMRGQWYGGAVTTCTLSPKEGSHPGFGIEAGRYTMTARWSASIRGIIPVGEDFGSLTVGGAWLYRVAASRNRVFDFYCGGGAILGIDFDEVNSAIKEVISDDGTDTSATWTQSESGAVRHSAFTYGIEPAAELELFFTSKAAFVTCLSIPVRLLTRQETLSLRASAGIRINF